MKKDCNDDIHDHLCDCNEPQGEKVSVDTIVIKPMFTNAELNDLESYIDNIERDGTYWGNKNHFIQRKESIKAKLNYMRKAL